jgi:hypothetical protein
MALPVRLPAAEDKVVEIEWTVMRQGLAGSENRSFHLVLRLSQVVPAGAFPIQP